jgi:hypothetical protein
MLIILGTLMRTSGTNLAKVLHLLMVNEPNKSKIYVHRCMQAGNENQFDDDDDDDDD